MNRLRWLLLSFILLGILTLALISPDIIGQASVGGIREITIQARAFEYTPRKIYVQKGETVRLTLIANDVTHGLILENYDVELESVPRQDPPPTIEFVADKAGLHHFRCTVVCGPLHPFMVGELIVEPYQKLPIAWGLTLVVAFVSVAAVQRWGHDPNKDPLGGWVFELTRFEWIRTMLKSRWFQFALFIPNIFFFAVIMAADSATASVVGDAGSTPAPLLAPLAVPLPAPGTPGVPQTATDSLPPSTRLPAGDDAHVSLTQWLRQAGGGVCNDQGYQGDTDAPLDVNLFSSATQHVWSCELTQRRELLLL